MLAVLGFAICTLSLSSVASHAQTVAFDLEDQMTSPGVQDQGRLSALTLEKNGVALRITRPGSVFDLNDNSALGPNWRKADEFGAVSLSTFFESHTATALVIDFSVPVAAFALDIGDFSQDTDNLELEAFSEIGGGGQSLARSTAVLDDNDSYDKFTFKHLEVRSENIRSVRILCGSSTAAHSMFYDNFTIELATPSSGCFYFPKTRSKAASTH